MQNGLETQPIDGGKGAGSGEPALVAEGRRVEHGERRRRRGVAERIGRPEQEQAGRAHRSGEMTHAGVTAEVCVRTVQEGSFMRSGGVTVSFAQQVDGGRIDITLTRASDATGASGTGLLAAVLFDAVGAGNVTLSMAGTATGPGGTPMGLQFRPVALTVQP